MGRHFRSSRRDDSEATDQTNREKYFHKSGNTSHPRRHTESDASYNHWQTDYPDPEVGSLYRASTIDRWDDRHRQRAARQPMVEYMCEEPVKEQDENERPITIPCRKRCCQPEPDDEEAPLTIPSTYQYDPSAHISASSSRTAPSHAQPLSSYKIDPHRHHHDQHHSHNPYFENEASNPSPHGRNDHDNNDNENENGEAETPGFGKDELVSKVSAYVLSRSGAHGPLTPESKRLVHSLANEILTALRTGSWDQVPRDLVREVQQVLT